MNAALPNEPLKDVVFIRVEETQEMNAVFRDRFKTAERIESGIAGRAHKAGGVLDAVVVRDCDDLNAGFKAGFDDRPVVIVFRRKSARLVVRIEIGERVDLQDAAIEPRTVRKIHRGLHAIRERTRQAGRLCGHVRFSVNFTVSNLIPAPIVLLVRRRTAQPHPAQPRPATPSSAWRAVPEPRRYPVES